LKKVKIQSFEHKQMAIFLSPLLGYCKVPNNI
jgi:hypothetical protein